MIVGYEKREFIQLKLKIGNDRFADEVKKLYYGKC